jgi:hypothetical protein
MFRRVGYRFASARLCRSGFSVYDKMGGVREIGMRHQRVGLIIGGLVAAASAMPPESAWAQQWQWPAPQAPQQAAPQQAAPQQEPAPAAPPRAAKKPRNQPPPTQMLEQDPEPLPDTGQQPATGRAAKKPAAQPAARTVACGGAFAKDSSHVKLATAFGAQNLDWAEVEGPENTRLNASVLFPKDPKRRLEVLWKNEAARSGTSLIVINGQSGWTAPKGLKLGVPLAALEKLNNKPFALSGFDQPIAGAVLDWQDGALANLPGGCTVGVRFVPDPKAADEAKAVTGRQLMSSDAVVRAAKPKIAEIILGYPQ